MLKEFIEELEKQQKSTHTIKSYEHRLSLFFEWLKSRYDESDKTQILSIDVKDYINYLLNVEKKAPSTINLSYSAIKSYCNFLMASGVLDKHPCMEADKGFSLKRPEEAPTVLDRNEFNRLRRTLYKYGNRRDIAIFEVLVCTGIRVSELIDLHIDDVELSDRSGTFKVRSGKGRKYREIPLADKNVRQAIKNYLEVRPKSEHPHLFLGNRGPFKTTQTINKMLEKYTDWASIPHKKVTPHLLRHQFAMYMAREKKIDLSLLKELLGHDDINTTAIYTKPTREEKEQALSDMYV